ALNLPHEEGAASGRGAPRERRPASDLLESTLRAPAYRLWEAAGFGHEISERAAWILTDAAAGVRWLAWPDARRYLRARWDGPVPANAVAIVHTHPAAVDPKPSEQDIETARQLGVPVYTVSRSGIWKAVPDGPVVAVDDARWWTGCRSGACDETRDPDFRSARGFFDRRNLEPESAYP
ncbi:MAG TPA: Mov34/MPN/PAD-1 family protein, partial [Thermoanaerobaculia bacterium]|nr:Mov34/MPN/PAD-1 family protein [Thermoanaerobaculia bacterium]